MNVGILEKLTAVRLAIGHGVYIRDGVAYRSCIAQTLVGLREMSAGFDALSLVDAVSGRALALLHAVSKRRPADVVATGEAADDESVAQPPARDEIALVIGVPESSITFSSVIEADQPSTGSSSGTERDGEKRNAKSSAKPILKASQVITFGKSKIRVSAKVRAEELDKIKKALSLRTLRGHVFEPAPCAAWRASLHYAPLKPRRGLHLRYLLGDKRGLAYLGTAKGPIAWQVMAWDDGEMLESLLQAFNLLEIHAQRRLGIGRVQHISVQGAIADEQEKELATQCGLAVSVVDGPPYTPELVSFGLALGSFETEGTALNLASSLQEPPGLMKRVPWGDVVMLSAVFFGMYVTLQYHRDDLAQQLATATHQNASVKWAAPLTSTQLNQEFAALQHQVSPLQKFVDRRLRFSSSLAAIATELPANTWLVNVTGEDLAWEKNPNKALGERYVLLQIGAPAERRGEVPPEVNATVGRLMENEYLGKTLPRIKLADVMWQERGGEGHSVFSILALPKN